MEALKSLIDGIMVMGDRVILERVDVMAMLGIPM